MENMLRRNPAASLEEVYEECVAEHEGKVRMNQISPKAFEAIRLRTALILFEGEYSGVIQPDEHYITLNKDYSNFEEVIEKIKDTDFLHEITQRAHEDIIQSGKYSYRKFVSEVDSEVSKLLLREPRCSFYTTPVFAKERDGDIQMILASGSNGLLNTRPLDEEFTYYQAIEMAGSLGAPGKSRHSHGARGAPDLSDSAIGRMRPGHVFCAKCISD